MAGRVHEVGRELLQVITLREENYFFRLVQKKFVFLQFDISYECYNGKDTQFLYYRTYRPREEHVGRPIAGGNEHGVGARDAGSGVGRYGAGEGAWHYYQESRYTDEL